MQKVPNINQAFPPHLCGQRRGIRAQQWDCQDLHHHLEEDAGRRGGCACVCVCVCVLLSTSFTTQLIRLAALGNCNVNSRAPFIEQPGQCLPRTPILHTANKMHTEDFLSPKNALLPPCPCTSKTLLPLPLAALMRGTGLFKNWGKFQAQNEADFNSGVNPGGLQSQQLC